MAREYAPILSDVYLVAIDSVPSIAMIRSDSSSEPSAVEESLRSLSIVDFLSVEYQSGTLNSTTLGS